MLDSLPSTTRSCLGFASAFNGRRPASGRSADGRVRNVVAIEDGEVGPIGDHRAKGAPDATVQRGRSFAEADTVPRRRQCYRESELPWPIDYDEVVARVGVDIALRQGVLSLLLARVLAKVDGGMAGRTTAIVD